MLNSFLTITASRLGDETLRFRQARIEKLENLLRRWDYGIFHILPGNRLVNLQKIETIVSDDLSLTNYLAAPRSDIDAFMRIFNG